MLLVLKRKKKNNPLVTVAFESLPKRKNNVKVVTWHVQFAGHKIFFAC